MDLERIEKTFNNLYCRKQKNLKHCKSEEFKTSSHFSNKNTFSETLLNKFSGISGDVAQKRKKNSSNQNSQRGSCPVIFECSSFSSSQESFVDSDNDEVSEPKFTTETIKTLSQSGTIKTTSASLMLSAKKKFIGQKMKTRNKLSSECESHSNSGTFNPSIKAARRKEKKKITKD